MKTTYGDLWLSGWRFAARGFPDSDRDWKSPNSRRSSSDWWIELTKSGRFLRSNQAFWRRIFAFPSRYTRYSMLGQYNRAATRICQGGVCLRSYHFESDRNDHLNDTFTGHVTSSKVYQWHSSRAYTLLGLSHTHPSTFLIKCRHDTAFLLFTLEHWSW